MSSSGRQSLANDNTDVQCVHETIFSSLQASTVIVLTRSITLMVLLYTVHMVLCFLLLAHNSHTVDNVVLDHWWNAVDVELLYTVRMVLYSLLLAHDSHVDSHVVDSVVLDYWCNPVDVEFLCTVRLAR